MRIFRDRRRLLVLTVLAFWMAVGREAAINKG